MKKILFYCVLLTLVIISAQAVTMMVHQIKGDNVVSYSRFYSLDKNGNKKFNLTGLISPIQSEFQSQSNNLITMGEFFDFDNKSIEVRNYVSPYIAFGKSKIETESLPFLLPVWFLFFAYVFSCFFKKRNNEKKGKDVIPPMTLGEEEYCCFEEDFIFNFSFWDFFKR